MEVARCFGELLVLGVVYYSSNVFPEREFCREPLFHFREIVSLLTANSTAGMLGNMFKFVSLICV